MFALVACTGGGRMEAELSHIDSLAEADQSAAIARIDSITAASGGGMGRSVRMRLALLRAKACNKLLLPLNRDSLLMLDGYFTDHGTPNERMLAKYIIGCSYLDYNDAPRAVECFQKAISCADTLDNKNCDYNTLSRIYGQLGQLQLEQMLPTDALKSGHCAIRYSLTAKDTLYAISIYNFSAHIYRQLGMFDSVMYVCDNTERLLKNNKDTGQIVSVYGIKMFTLVESGKINDAKPYIDFYEKYSGLYDIKTKSMEDGHEIYYYIKGLSYLYANRLDSAEYFFRKELRSTTDFNNRQAASRGLYLLYKRRGVNDSITKYAEMWNTATDSAYANMSTRHLQQMKAMYDYSNSERIAEQKEAEAERYKYLAVSFVFAFALAVFIILYILQRRKKGIERIKKLNATNAMYIMLLKKKEKELEAALSDNVRNTALIDEKKSEIKQLEEKISALRGGDFNALRHDKALIYDAPIIDTMHELAGSSCKATVAEISCLRKHADDFLPDFMESLDIEKNNLGNLEVAVCILVKLQFITSEISCLLDISPQRLTNIRKRLNMKIFGEDGGAKEFDLRIRRTLPTD